MIYYDKEWKLSSTKVEFYDLELDRYMTNFVGAENKEWWESLDFIKDLRFTNIDYSKDILSRMNNVKDVSQFISSLEIDMYVFENKLFDDTKIFKGVPGDVELIDRVEYMKQFENEEV